MSKPSQTESRVAQYVVVLLVFVLVVSVVGYLWFPLLGWTEQRDAGEKVVKDQMNAQKAVENYEWFRQQWHDIQAQRKVIQNHYEAREHFYEIHGEDPENWSRQARERHSRINTRITGSKNHLENLISEYNARSDQAHRSVFKCHLPYQVDKRFAITGPPGSGSPETPNDQYVDGANPNKTPPKPEQCDGLPDKVNSN